MNEREAIELMKVLGSRESAVANDCAELWDEAWQAYDADRPETHFDLAQGAH